MSQYQNIYLIISDMICDAKDLDDSEVNEDLTLVQLEFDSLDYVELMVLAKREFNITLTAEFFIEHPNLSIKSLCEYLEQKAEV
ncbi:MULTISPECIES: acyl carrier protein [Providencia]|uniref:acyl carrier protein n=1 Tax=Providencia TaxID=586 RepID=UPI00300CE4CD